MSAWTEHRNPQGRPYWYHSQTQQSVWEKPQELKSPLELALSELGWKQYESNGRSYYVNDSSKETTWEIPKDVKQKADQAAADNIKAQAARKPQSPVPTTAPTRPAAIAAGSPLPDSAMQVAAPGQFGPGGGAYPLGSSAMQQQQQLQHVDLDFKTREDAEQAFFGMLRSHNVTPSWTWEQVLRTTVTDPYFKALRTLGERKEAFEKYCDDTKRRERENKEKSMDRNRPAWRTALGRLSEGDYGMKSWWSWERASRAIREAVPDVWGMSRHDEEREALWREYMDELHRKEQKRQQEIRQMNIEKLAEILKTLNLDLSIRYNEAANMVKDTKDWKEDADLQSIEALDFLIVYEESVKRSEQETAQSKHKQKTERQREIRKNREAYLGLLDELKSSGKIVAGTKWKEVYPLLSSEDRFIDMLSNPGSTPLELFWDVVDDLDYKIEEDSRVIENVLSERTGNTFKVTPETKFEEFDEKINDHIRVKNIKVEDRRAVFKGLLDRLATQAREERRRAERRLRHATEDLRYALKKLSPPLDPDTTTYEDALSRFSDMPEYKELEGREEARRAAFDKYVARLKEKKLEEEEEEKKWVAKEEEEQAKRAEREREKDRDAPMSDGGGSATSRRKRHASRTVTDGGRGTPKRDSLAVLPDVAASPVRSEHRSSSRRERERETSPATVPKSRRANSRDGKDEERSDRRDRDRERDRQDRDRSERDRDRESRSSRSHRDRDRDGRDGRERGYDSEEDRRYKRRSSRRDEEGDERDSGSRRRSSRRTGDEEVSEPRKEREEKRSSKRREEDGGDKEGLVDTSGDRDAKRQKMEVDELAASAMATPAATSKAVAKNDEELEEGEI